MNKTVKSMYRVQERNGGSVERRSKIIIEARYNGLRAQLHSNGRVILSVRKTNNECPIYIPCK